MFDQIALGREFFEELERIDAAITAAVAAGGCPRCRGPLHRGDYLRKPRGGRIAEAGEALSRRFSLCCGWEGCRRRATPPSLRFLGRRVYLGAVVVVASVVALRLEAARAIRQATGVPARTTRRWRAWWQGPFATTHVFVALAARMLPVIPTSLLPTSVLERLPGDAAERVRRLLAWLAPLTTRSVADGSRFVREGG